ncbi:MAG: ABC transporter substrate-binding protein, partial [Lachnospiraceae bacterium]
MKRKFLMTTAGVLATAMALCACGSGSTATTSETAATTAATEAAADTASSTDTASSSDTTATTEAAADSSDKVTITFWHSMGGVNGDALNYLVDKYNKENTDGVYVDAEYQGEYDDTLNKLKSAQIGNMGADLVQIYEIGTRFMIDSGWVVPMQDLIDKDGYDISQLEPNIAAYYTVDDKLY